MFPPLYSTIARMARLALRPPFPDSPGAWLACYRYRRWLEGEVASSPEQIAELLGVSGPTVRRWETGRSTPSHFDLQRFAEVCRLSPIETSFLVAAFDAREVERPPDEDVFKESARQLLSIEFPAYLLDSFFFVRAWNSYMDVLDGPIAGSGQAPNILRGPIVGATQPNALEDPQQRLWRWLRDFWMSTAELCGSLPYKRVLRELSAIPGFEANWRHMPLERSRWQLWSFSTPYSFSNERVGSFTVFPSRVIVPPTYHLRVYVPLDDRAVARLDASRLKGPSRPVFTPEVHWSNRFVRSV